MCHVPSRKIAEGVIYIWKATNIHSKKRHKKVPKTNKFLSLGWYLLGIENCTPCQQYKIHLYLFC
uniref:Uncharacterized protein n=1 Tax=Anguilla anguilla TaxID=7936 RepID=A0A0E9WXN6_ANGAN